MYRGVSRSFGADGICLSQAGLKIMFTFAWRKQGRGGEDIPQYLFCVAFDRNLAWCELDFYRVGTRLFCASLYRACWGDGRRESAISVIFIRWRPVILLWVVFRADSLTLAVRYIGQMFGTGGALWDEAAASAFSGSILVLLTAAVLSTPVWKQLADRLHLSELTRKNVAAAAAVPLFLLCIAKCMSSSYNPFIYFNF